MEDTLELYNLRGAYCRTLQIHGRRYSVPIEIASVLLLAIEGYIACINKRDQEATFA
jgi:hypothetical protein